MATKNFIVQNGITVGGVTIDATTGNIYTTGNIVTTGSGTIISANGFGGLNPSQIYSGSSNVTVTSTLVNVAISGTNVASFSSSGIAGTLTTASQTNITGVGTITTGTWSATTIATSKGGTGLTSFTSGGALYATSTSALTTGTLPVASGGTGVTTSTGTGSVVLSASPTFTGTISAAELTLSGNLTVNGTTTTINSTTLAVDDKNIVLGDVTTPTDLTADGGGITLKGATDKTLNWVDATDAWTSSEHMNLASGKAYYINGTSVLSASTLGSGVTASSLTSVGTLTGLTVSGAPVPNANATVNLGSTSAWWNNVYGVTFIGVATTAKYADLAENYLGDQEYEPGTVVHFGGEAEVTLCDEDMCQRVAGVVSTNPAYLMNSDLEGTKVAVAFQGRVPCKVTGTVRKGDMMVSAGNGRARAEANPKVGSVIGKALENFDGSEGVIEVVVGRD